MRTIRHIRLLGALASLLLSQVSLGVDDGRTELGDISIETQAPYLNQDDVAPAEIEMGGFLPERILGLGPGQTLRREDGKPILDEASVPSGGTIEPVAPKVAPRKPASKGEVATKGKKVISVKVKKPAKAAPKKWDYRIKTKPKFWTKVFHISLFDGVARADTLADAQRAFFMQTGRTMTPQELQQAAFMAQEQQQGGGGGSGGGGSGGGGGGGGGAADALFGVAAIIAAASPAVIAAIQADADKAIAKTNADAQIAITGIASETAISNGETTKDIAMAQMETGKEINSNNLQGGLTRDRMQLGELRDARQDANAMEMEKLAYQNQLQNQQLVMAEGQAKFAQEFEMKKTRLQAQVNGLAYGQSRDPVKASKLTGTVTASAGTVLSAIKPYSRGKVISVASRSNSTLLRAKRRSAKGLFSNLQVSRGVSVTVADVSFPGLAGGSTASSRNRIQVASAKSVLPVPASLPARGVASSNEPTRRIKSFTASQESEDDAGVSSFTSRHRSEAEPMTGGLTH